MNPAHRLALVIFACGLCMSIGWLIGQDSTRCADWRGHRVCIETNPEGEPRAYDPEAQR